MSTEIWRQKDKLKGICFDFINLYHSLGKFHRCRIYNIFHFFFFFQKKDLTFRVHCILICMDYQSLFSGKKKNKKKECLKCHLLNILPSMLSVKECPVICDISTCFTDCYMYIYRKTSMTRTPMARLLWLIRTRFFSPWEILPIA